MDEAVYKEALLRKRTEIFTEGGMKPLHTSMENNTRQGDMADQATGNNEVHIQLKLKHDPDAKITKMKDGRTHLAHTAEQVVDLDTGAIVGVTVQDADDGDTTTMVETLITAAEQVEAVLPAGAGIAEVVGDKGYHSNETMVAFAALGVRSYVSEPDRGRRNWKAKAAARDAVYANRRRIRGARGQRLLRQRGELLERPNAHLYETGRLRRVHLRHHPNILKRVLVQVCGFNLGLLMRQLRRMPRFCRPSRRRCGAWTRGTYGICRDCGEPVAPGRLNAIPWTRVCIECKEKQHTA